MEEEKMFECPPGLNWQSAAVVGGSSPAGQVQPGFLHLNWDSSMDHSAAQFESALSSMVSSPSNPTPPSADSVTIRELIGRLGSICHAGEISPQSHQYIMVGGNNSASTSCYSTPLNSPPKLNLSSMLDHHLTIVGGGGVPIQGNPAVPPLPTHLAPFAADPEFAERAARFSCFGGRGYDGHHQFGLVEPGKLSRVPSSQSLKAGGLQMSAPDDTKEVPPQDGSQPENGDLSSKFATRLSRSSTPDDANFGGAREESSASQQLTVNSGETAAGSRGPTDGNARKRKAASKGKVKDIPQSPSIKDPSKMAEEDDSNAKRSRSAETSGTATKDDVKPKVEQEGTCNNGDGSSGLKQGKDNSSKPPEVPKQDYIHVRARRGQATDSHSLAERVRREKISQRMKFLQDLVPGCNKVTGKALMLDEIINYVQSLQRQVELLSVAHVCVAVPLHEIGNCESPVRFQRRDSSRQGCKQSPLQQALITKILVCAVADIKIGLLSMSLCVCVCVCAQMHQSARGCLLPHSLYQLEAASAAAFPYAQQTPPQQGTPLQSVVSNGLESQCPVNTLDATQRRTLSMQLASMDGFVLDAASQLGAFWEEDDLQSVVQMGFGPNEEAGFSSHSFQGSMPTNHMKIEL